MRVLTTRKGARVETPYADAEALSRLLALYRDGKLVSSFARSLVDQHLLGRRPLSEEQLKYVHMLVLEIENATAKHEVRAQLPGIVALLDKARASGLAYPRVRLPGVTVKHGKQGDLIVHGASWRERLGIIEPSGAFRATAACTQETLELLQAFDEDPTSVGMLLGIKTGCCCFCGRELTTAESCSVGYGPVCAGNFGLPWGPDVLETRIERLKRTASRLAELKMEVQSS